MFSVEALFDRTVCFFIEVLEELDRVIGDSCWIKDDFIEFRNLLEKLYSIGAHREIESGVFEIKSLSQRRIFLERRDHQRLVQVDEKSLLLGEISRKGELVTAYESI